LTLFLFSQLETYDSKTLKKDFENIILNSVRILTENASEELQISLKYLFETKEFIQNYENDDPKNTSRPIDAPNIPVNIPMTGEMVEKINTMIEVSEKALAALEIAEMSAIEEKREVRDFIIQIAEIFQNNKKEIDNIINTLVSGWNIERMITIDKDIIRIAICELVYIKQIAPKVVINEAIELAKKYSTADSASFVNGVLAKVVDEYGIK